MTEIPSKLKATRLFSSYYLLALACSLGYPAVFSLLYPATAEVVACSMAHALLSATVTYRVVSCLFLKRSYPPSLATMFVVINLLYFNASSIKYFEPELYPGFISNNLHRLMYSILALIILWASFEIIVRLKSRYKQPQVATQNRTLLKIVIIGILGFYCIDMSLKFYQKGFGYFYLSDSGAAQLAMERADKPVTEKLRIWFLESTGAIMVLLVTLSQCEKGNKVYLLAPIFVYLISSLLSGNRGLLFSFALGLGFSLSYLYGYKNKTFARALFAGPMILGLGSVLILSVAGRVSSDSKEDLRRQLAYRFDLTDYGATIIESNVPVLLNYGQVVDAFYASIPKILYPGKYDANRNTVYEVLYGANLDPQVDYTDTYFSIGAQISGIIGFIWAPLIMVLVLHGVEQLFYRQLPSMAYYIIILMFPVFPRAEGSFSAIFGNWRNLPLYAVIGMVLFCIFAKKHEHWRANKHQICRGHTR